MMKYSSNALCSKAKSIYGDRITSVQYRELVKSPSVDSVVTFLKNETKFKSLLNDEHSIQIRRHQLEQIFKINYYQTFDRLLRYIPKSQNEFYLHEIMQIEISIILDKVIHLLIEDSVDFLQYMPTYLQSKVSFVMYELLNIESYRELLEFLKATKYYKILKKYDITTMEEYQKLEKELTEYYLSSCQEIIIRNYKGKIQKQLLRIFYTSVEIKNISKIYRLKKYYNVDNNEIEKLVPMKYSRLSKEMVDKLIYSKDASDFLKVLNTSKYKLYDDEKDFIYIEYSMDKILYHLAKKYMRFSNDAPVVFLTFCTLQNIEIANLKHVVEGVRYQKESEEIEKLLIIT